jgi:hypothetical protein
MSAAKNDPDAELPETAAATEEALAELENGKGADDNERLPVG